MTLPQLQSETRTRRGGESRARILDCAIDLLREGGMAALSISAVCARAGISATSVYHHFGSKAGLMAALAEHVWAINKAWVMARLSGLDNRQDQLEAYVGAIRDMIVQRRPSVSLIFAALGQARTQGPEVADAIVAARKETLNVMAREFEAFLGIPDGTRFAHAAAAFEAYAVQVYQETDDEADVDALLDTFKLTLVLIGHNMMSNEPFSNETKVLLSRLLKGPQSLHNGETP